MILVIDNYDSFTYNLVQYLGEMGADIEVIRNDEATVPEILKKKPDHILISPLQRPAKTLALHLSPVRVRMTKSTLFCFVFHVCVAPSHYFPP